MSTVDMGLRLDTRRLEARDMRLLDIDDWDDRAEAIEAEGEVERGVETSDEVAVLNEYDAIGTMAWAGEVEEEEQQDEVEAWKNRREQ